MNHGAAIPFEHVASSSIGAIHYATGEPVRVEIAAGTIRAIVPVSRGEAAPDLPTIAPGLVDLQVNGYAGRDFNAPPFGDAMVGEIVRLLWREGVTTFFPTVITNDADAIQDAVGTIARACQTDPAAHRGVGGIHLEGPFISAEDGPRGAHARQHVRPPDWDLFCRWQEAAGGRIRIVTMSPEWPGSVEFIMRCAASGVTVSIGHTAATPEQVRDAVRAGARMSTHLGNAAHLLLPRHPNYIWEQLAQDALWSCVIADGFHLPTQVLKVVMKVKGEHAMLVSDAVCQAGMPPGTYDAPVGGRVVLTPAGRLHLEQNDKLLAGSAQMLLWGVRHLIDEQLADFPQAWAMASTRPACFMGLPAAGGLAPGSPADFVLLGRGTTSLHVQATFKAGEQVHDTGNS